MIWNFIIYNGNTLTMEKGYVHVQVDDIREVFRKVSPYVTRQWKQLCKELDIQDSDLSAIENNSGFESSLSQFAYKGMCLWHERSNGKANKERLTAALHACGLKRAEEEIKNIDLRMLVVGSSSSSRPSSSSTKSSISRPPSSRVSSARQKKFPVPKVVYRQGGLSSRPVSGRGRFIRSARSRSAKKKKSEEDSFCEICLKVNVRYIHPANKSEFEGIIKQRQHGKEMVEKFYTAIHENSEHYINVLENSIDIRGVKVMGLTTGSLIIRCQCRTLGALESLNQMCKSRRLLAICKSVFVTDEMLSYVGANVLDIDVNIREEELDDCRESLLSRKFKDTTSIHPADTLFSPLDEPKNDHTITDDRKENFNVNKWRRHISEETNTVKERYQKFTESMSDFLRTLQIILPQGREKIFCLSDVIGLLNYLTDTSSVSSGVRTDLVREFISIVNHIRLVTADIKQNASLAFMDDNSDSESDDFKIMDCLVNDIEQMLQPKNDFEEDVSVLDKKINPAEKPFIGLMCFVPLLLAKLSTVLYTLSAPT